MKLFRSILFALCFAFSGGCASHVPVATAPSIINWTNSCKENPMGKRLHEVMYWVDWLGLILAWGCLFLILYAASRHL